LFKVSHFWLNFPSNLDFQQIREIRIVPRNKTFYIEWVYQVNPEPVAVDKSQALGIDHGLNNWLTCVSNVGTSFIASKR
ncbi:MAG: transposase, partial [Kamptonema sp. SIO4C4]|nr:transposase [Kamptonema sp. SIO4C4]